MPLWMSEFYILYSFMTPYRLGSLLTLLEHICLMSILPFSPSLFLGFSKRRWVGKAIIWKGKFHDRTMEELWPPQFFGTEILLLRIMCLPELSTVIFRL